MKYIVWDLETDHSATDWCSILEIGCILLDSNFKEEQRFQARCRLPDDRVPTATALCINRTNVDLLTKSNLSHYQLVNQIEKLFTGIDENIYRTKSGRDLISVLNHKTEMLVCSLVHKFGRKSDESLLFRFVKLPPNFGRNRSKIPSMA